MFSILKAIQNVIEFLKQKRGLWFAILSVATIVGIAMSMYLLTTMTKGIAKDVYVNMSSTYKNNLDSKLENLEKDYKSIYVGLTANNTLITNLSNSTRIKAIIDGYTEKYNQAGFENLQIEFYSTVNQINNYRISINSVITKKESSFGLEVLSDGVYVTYINPIIDGTNTLGVIEVRQPINILKRDFEINNGIFLYLMDQKMLATLSSEAKNGKYREVFNELIVEEEAYDGQFYGNIIESGKDNYKIFLDSEYLVNSSYFKTYKKISDINGNDIGYIILGEKVAGSGALVNIVDNMTKTVTTVALGLVISILLFMF